MVMGISKGIRVSPKDGEAARKILRNQNVLDQKKVKLDRGPIFPVKNLNFDLGGIEFEVLEDEFEELKRYKHFENLMENLGCPLSSYDVLGDIALLEIPPGFEGYESGIGKALLESKKNIKSVFKKFSSIEGDERLRKLKWLAGENRTETVHREHGCEFKMDIAKVFFSPRLAFERQRIKEQVNDGETVVDMFAGLGPYSIVIAKHRDVRVSGYDINEYAIHYFKENIRINKVGDRVNAVHGDCRLLARKGSADRAIMNLPNKSRNFLDSALSIIKKKGGIIHYYGVSPRNNPYKGEVSFIREKASLREVELEVIGKRIVRSYSPSKVHVAIDIGVKP
jgi:tRNA (guanine37-N1)-methyltransferase